MSDLTPLLVTPLLRYSSSCLNVRPAPLLELVSECQTSYIEDASAPVDNIVDVAGRGDTVQTECH
jgi:hypothetical protein